MADLKYYDIILKPVITEKSMDEMADKKYVFYVHPHANKSQIREAVQKMFEGTVVERVNTMNMVGKKKRTRSYKYGRTSKRKKAIVTLTPGSKEIEIFQGM
jgi:large subunit ribosomal protein L23